MVPSQLAARWRHCSVRVHLCSVVARRSMCCLSAASTLLGSRAIASARDVYCSCMCVGGGGRTCVCICVFGGGGRLSASLLCA